MIVTMTAWCTTTTGPSPRSSLPSGGMASGRRGREPAALSVYGRQWLGHRPGCLRGAHLSFTGGRCWLLSGGCGSSWSAAQADEPSETLGQRKSSPGGTPPDKDGIVLKHCSLDQSSCGRDAWHAAALSTQLQRLLLVVEQRPPRRG